MAVNYTDFEKIWASASPLTPYSFTDANYKRGWDFVGSTPPSRQMWDAFMQHADEKLQYLYLHEDVPVGHEYFTFNPNVPQGSLPLFGGEYSRETYSALWSWVQQQTGYLKTEAEWQTLATANNGNVPYYSDGDGSTTFRVPALKCYIKAADGTVTEVGSYYAAGVPNITGSANLSGVYDADTSASGAFRKNTVSGTRPAGYSSSNIAQLTFDASRSSSVYGNSSTVTPETVVGLWLVKAYGVIQDTGTINEQQYIDDRIATEVTRADGKYLPLAGGTMTGDISSNANASFVIKHSGQEQGVQILSGENDNFDGATLQLFAPQHSTYAGQFWIRASTKTSYDDTDVTHKSYELTGKPDGTLTWANKTVITGTEYSQTFTTNKLAANAEQNFTLTAQPKYWSVICNTGGGWSSLLFAVNGGKTLRVTNKNTSTLSENVNFTINYIA